MVEPSEQGLLQSLLSGLQTLTLDLPTGDAQRLIQYIELLAHWNRAYNLTAVRDPRQMVPRHLLDSLSIQPYIHGQRVLDVGTGAGLPGLPLAIACPHRQFALLDSNGKKTRFVQQAILELAIDNAEVVQSRAEDYRPLETYDTVVTRAFASLSDILARTTRLIRAGGRLLCMQGTPPTKELEAPAFDPLHVEVLPITVPQLDAQRHAVIVEFEDAVV